MVGVTCGEDMKLADRKPERNEKAKEINGLQPLSKA